MALAPRKAAGRSPPYHVPMLTLRRTTYEPRVEIMPLIDVIFLLLTFFIYAMVLMVRAELMPMKLQQFASAEQARPAPAVTVSIMLDGSILVDREPTKLEDVRAALEDARADDPETRLYLGLEAGEGAADRGPILTALWDQLQDAGLEIFFIGEMKSAAVSPSPAAPPPTAAPQ